MLHEKLTPEQYARVQKLRVLAEKIFVPFLMVIVGLVIFKPIETWWTGPEVYKVYLVGNKDDSETQRIFRSIQQESALAKLKIDGREIDVEEKDDRGDINVAQQIANKLAAGPDTLMVIGHVFSARTKEMLPIYMGANPKVPVITTRETTPTLLGKVQYCYEPRYYCPLIPMSPTDNDQARAIVDVAESQHADTFLILREDDKKNVDYISGLVSALRDDIQADSNRTGTHVVAEIPILDQLSIEGAVGLTLAQHPMCVVYIGNFVTGRQYLTLLSQESKDQSKAQSKAQRPPIIILSDSSVGQDLLAAGVGPVLVSYQLSGEQYLAADNVYGVDAFAIVKQLVRQVNEDPGALGIEWHSSMRHFLNMHRVRDARAALIQVMQGNADSGSPYVGLNERKYAYLKRYTRQDSFFHVWRVENRRITEADAHDGAPGLWPPGAVAVGLKTPIADTRKRAHAQSLPLSH